jgi:hypothetical protein
VWQFIAGVLVGIAVGMVIMAALVASSRRP